MLDYKIHTSGFVISLIQFSHSLCISLPWVELRVFWFFLLCGVIEFIIEKGKDDKDRKGW